MPPVERQLAAILHADVEGYSRLMADDEAATIRILGAYRDEISMLVPQHRGRVVDNPGDEFLAEFPTALDAVEAAVEIQRVLAARNAGLPEARRMKLRIGIHMGDVSTDGERIYGDGVNIASRLQSLAEPGGLCISSTVREQVRGKLELTYDDLGDQEVKNIPEPVHVYRARWSDATEPVTDTVIPVAQSGPSVAVLPFVNMSPESDQEYFADGIAEELINALAQVRGLRVIARTSAFGFKGTDADISAIGSKLNVSAIVEGSVRKAGDRVRIVAQLVDVAGGHHLWSERYDRPLDDVFEIQDEIARTIVATIGPKLLGDSPEPLVTRPTESPEAYELYLSAGERLARVERWDTRTAIETLRDAAALDPDYADAWARLGLACAQMLHSFESDPRWYELWEQALDRALSLDPTNADAELARGRILWVPRSGFQNRPALRSTGKAVELQPGSHEALLWHQIIRFHVGLMEEANEGLTAALSLKPDDPMTLAMMAQVAVFQGRYEEANELFTRTLHADPTFMYGHLFRHVPRLYHDDLPGTEEALNRARQVIGDDPLLDASEALLWARRGEAGRAEAALTRAMQDKGNYDFRLTRPTGSSTMGP